jgi:Na+:H+ antiporter, NhaA family
MAELFFGGSGHEPKSAADARLARLPTGLVDRLTKPFAQFLRIEAAAGSVLLLCTVVTLALSNSSWGPYFLKAWETPVGVQIGSLEFARSLRDWINDGLMTLFFFVVALELKRELVLGELRNPRMAALSMAAALGGMLVPAALYLLLQFGQPGESGWGTVMATDTAFVVACLALLGPRIPHSLRMFRRLLTTSAPFWWWQSATPVIFIGARSLWVRLASQSCVEWRCSASGVFQSTS